MHNLAALLANPPPSSATSIAFGAGSMAAAFGALVPAAFGSMPAGFGSIGQPTNTKPALMTSARTFAFGVGLMPAAPTTVVFKFGTPPQPARFQEDIPGIWTHMANNKNEGIPSTKEAMHPEAVEDKWRILVTHTQDDFRHIRKHIYERNFSFIVMCAAFLLMMSINIFAYS
jgi:hypothetical protein